MAKQRLAFLGTPDFALPAFEALAAAGHEMAAVYTQPPRPAGRGGALRRSPVHRRAEERGIPVRTPRTLKDEAEQAAFRDLGLDAAVVVAYGLILPEPVLDAPRLGCFNIHASLLPRWRGAAPIQHALLAGDRETGVTIMQMDAGLDTGPMLLRKVGPIAPDETAGSLHDRLAALGAEAIVEALDGLVAGRLKPAPQPEEGATYARKLERGDERLDWRQPAVSLERRVRALAPVPGAYFTVDETPIKVLAATVIDAAGEPGTVLDERLTVACGDGALRPTRVQRPGKRPVTTEELLRGFPAPAGTRLG